MLDNVVFVKEHSDLLDNVVFVKEHSDLLDNVVFVKEYSYLLDNNWDWDIPYGCPFVAKLYCSCVMYKTKLYVITKYTNVNFIMFI